MSRRRRSDSEKVLAELISLFLLLVTLPFVLTKKLNQNPTPINQAIVVLIWVLVAILVISILL